MVQTSETTGKPELRMSRTFDAPLHLVPVAHAGWTSSLDNLASVLKSIRS